MNSPERRRLPSSILHHSLMFKIIVFYLFHNRKCFKIKLDQRRAAKSEILNAFTDPNSISKVTFFVMQSPYLPLFFYRHLSSFTILTCMDFSKAARAMQMNSYCSLVWIIPPLSLRNRQTIPRISTQFSFISCCIPGGMIRKLDMRPDK